MIVAAFVIAMLFMHYAVVRRLKRLTDATQQISLGKTGAVSAANRSAQRDESTSSHSPPSAAVSIDMAIQRLARSS